MIDYTKPEVIETIGKLIFSWPTMELKIVADRLTDAGTAELWFYHANDTGDSLLHTTKANLLSTSTMGQIGKRMVQHSEDIPWQQVLTYISAHSMESQRRGEPATVIEPDLAHIAHPGYYLEPIILKNSPTIIHGAKGVNKTTLCLTLLGLIATKHTGSPCGLAPAEKVNVGLLDWETNPNLTRYTIARLVKGGATPFFKLPYLRCQQPLADDIERIAGFIHEYGIKVALIDSLGQAAGSDKFDSSGKATALKFFECLRKLDITPLIIAQNSKAEEGKKTIYGSTYFTYYARNIFELKAKVDAMNENDIHLALSHQESNYSKKYPGLGFCVSYTDTTIGIKSESLNYSQFLEKQTQVDKVVEILCDGSKSRQAIAKYLGIEPGQADVVLNRAKAKHKVINLGSGIWELAVENDLN